MRVYCGVEIGGELVSVVAGIQLSLTGGFRGWFCYLYITSVLWWVDGAKKGRRPAVLGPFWVWLEVRPTAVRTGDLTTAELSRLVAVTVVAAVRCVSRVGGGDDGEEEGDCEDDTEDHADAEYEQCDECVHCLETSSLAARNNATIRVGPADASSG